jgi:membrane protein
MREVPLGAIIRCVGLVHREAREEEEKPLTSVDPPKLGFGKLCRCSIKAIERFGGDDMMTYAAAMAYLMLFSLYPFLISLSALLGILQIPGFFEQLVAQAQTVLPGQAMGIVEQVVGQIREQNSVGLLLFGIIATLWSASAAVRALMHALNSAYHVEQERATWKRYPLSIVYAIFLSVIAIAAAGLTLIKTQDMRWISEQLGISTLFVPLWTWLHFPVAILLLLGIVAFVYYMLPNAHEPLRLITPGAILAVLVWVATSLGFSYFVSSFVVYNATYGSLGTFMALQLYLFISAAVLLLGAEINVEIYYQLNEDDEEDDEEGEKKQQEEC